MADDELGWDLQPLPGGGSGRTWRTGGAHGAGVVRIFPPELPVRAPEVEASVLALVRGLVPVPEVLEVSRAVPGQDRPGLLVTAWVEGTSAAQAWEQWDAGRRVRFGTQMGEWAATLAGMPFLRAGRFVDAALTLEPWDTYADGLEQWFQHHRPGLADWSPAELDGLAGVVVEAQRVLDGADRVSLVHSDLNPKNVVVDPRSAEVLALVDWEYAHAGHPATDLGNLLRLDRAPDYERAVLSAYVDRRGGTAEEAREAARSADLWALIELATRQPATPPTTRAATLLRAVARAGDLHAWPAQQ